MAPMTKHWRQGILLVAGMATVGTIVALNGGSTAPSATPLGNSPDVTLPGPERPDGVPCSPGDQVTLEVVARESDRPLLFPHHELAGPDSVKAAWVCGERLVKFEFESGLLFQIGPNEVPGDRAAFYARLEAENPGSRPITFRGHPGREVDPDATGTRVAGGIEWAEGKWIYGLAGMGKVSLETLREIADTISLYEPR